MHEDFNAPAGSGVIRGGEIPAQSSSGQAGSGQASASKSAGALFLDAEALYSELLRGVQMLLSPATRLVGITSGGAWLAERLQSDLKLPGTAGTISSAMHRDDFAKRGLAPGGQTLLPFDVNGAHILILDDVLYTGRTIRAVVNELFDYGRPARVQLAVLVDRGGRELPIQSDFAAARVALAEHQLLALARSDSGTFSFDVQER
jgi:pyrimidine operon attenuation protein/uracil phosphoribosyltransferase